MPFDKTQNCLSLKREVLRPPGTNMADPDYQFTTYRLSFRRLLNPIETVVERYIITFTYVNTIVRKMLISNNLPKYAKVAKSEI